MNKSSEFGSLVRYFRDRAGISHSALATAVNCDRTWISKIEAGELPHQETVRALDRQLDAGNALVERAQRDRARQHTRIPYTVSVPAGPELFGRADLLARLDKGLDPGRQQSPLLVLTGPPGVGKSALAATWAHSAAASYTDGVLYADLHGHAPGCDPVDPAETLAELLGDLGVDDPPASTQARSRLLKTLLVDKRVLLVLDDAASANQVLPLLPGGRDCAVLITTRHRLSRLSIRGNARHLQLEPLATSAASDLLASQIGIDGADPGILERIVQRCDQLPLALHAAAEHFHTTDQDLAALAAALDGPDRLRVLDDAVGDDLDASLSAAYTASYGDVSSGAAAVLARVAEGVHAACAAGPAERELAREGFLRTDCERQVYLPPLVAEWVRSHALLATQQIRPQPMQGALRVF